MVVDMPVRGADAAHRQEGLLAVDHDQAEELARALAPIVQAQITASIHESTATARTVRVAAGVVDAVLDDETDTVMVAMDDGGIPDAPLGAVIPALRMNDVAEGDRVRVHFYPATGAEAHRAET